MKTRAALIPTAALTAGLLACGGPLPEGTNSNPIDTLQQPTAYTDMNPDPGVVEVDMVARAATLEYLPGKPTEVWAYQDGMQPDRPVTVPGPLVLTTVGNLLIVHFHNQLPEPTTVHWHGLRLPNDMDGVPGTQRAVQPGESFDYRFVVKDAGTFWYHPHVHAPHQVEMGLQGAFVVREAAAPPVAADRIMMFDDVKLTWDGQVDQGVTQLDIMNGRRGNWLMVNGQHQRALTMAAGSWERWRFINSANGRYFRMAIPGASFTVVGWDGGLLEQPYTVDELLVAPGERYDVLVRLDGPTGTPWALQLLHHDGGTFTPDPGPQTLLTLHLAAANGTFSQSPAMGAPSFVPVAVETDTPVRPVVLTEQNTPGAGPRFFINEVAWPFDRPVRVTQGDVEIWEVANDADMDHPLHIHGLFFQVLSMSGQLPEHVGWKDTVNIPARATARLAMKYEEPGMWMFHCHILEHAEYGMMGSLEVQAALP